MFLEALRPELDESGVAPHPSVSRLVQKAVGPRMSPGLAARHCPDLGVRFPIPQDRGVALSQGRLRRLQSTEHRQLS